LRNQNGRGHADAEQRTEDQEQNQVGIGGGRQRRFAQKTADPHRVDRSVQRPQHIRPQHWKGEDKQGAGDRTCGEVAGAAARGRFDHDSQLGE
jgi:hypothetical protein